MITISLVVIQLGSCWTIGVRWHGGLGDLHDMRNCDEVLHRLYTRVPGLSPSEPSYHRPTLYLGVVYIVGDVSGTFERHGGFVY